MKVAVLGYGTVGKGVYDLLAEAPGLEQGPVLVREGKRTEDFMVTDMEDILNDGSVDVVVEATDAEFVAASYAEKSLKAGKHFVTSNKVMVAQKGIELSELAVKEGRAFLFSAACGGAIPFLHNLCIARESDVITGISGILNGTTNFILDLMQSEGVPFMSALSQAQKLGYAESDPSADISGTDSYRKIILACAVAYGLQPDGYSDIEGIAGFTQTDSDIIASKGGAVRLIARGGLNGDGTVYAFVEPRVFFDGIERSVGKNFNSISYTGKNSGPVTYSGQGAGRYPTASAVLRDITGIAEGAMYLLPEGCRRQKEVNSTEQSYLVRCADSQRERFSVSEVWSEQEGKAVFITERMSVSSMHSLARDMRNSGNELFFASVQR